MDEASPVISHVIDAVGRTFHDDKDAIDRFLNTPHTLLANRTPLDMTRSGPAGTDAVLALLRRADSGVAI